MTKKVLRIKARAVEVTLGLPKFRKKYGNGGLILTTSKAQIFTSREGKQRTRTIPADRVYGYQVEIASEKGGQSGRIYDEARRAFMFTESRTDPDAYIAFKDGKWNKFRVECKGNRIRTWINEIRWAPNQFKKRAQQSEKLVGLYLPYWTYDANTINKYK